MYEFIEKACDYLDMVVEQLKKGETEILFQCRDTINSIFFDGNKLDKTYVSVIPVDKLDYVCNFLSKVRMLSFVSKDKATREAYINEFIEVSQILKESMHESVPRRGKDISVSKEYDVFISHANADKMEYVDSLYNSIEKLGIKIFYDKEELSWGDNWKEKILYGTECSEFAIIIISNNFFDREWTEKELKEFLNRQNENRQKVILPLLYKINFEELSNKYPELGTIQALKADDVTNDEIAILLAKELIKRYKY